MNIFIFRHGETDWNLKGLMQGHKDIVLNQNGIEQASTIIPKLIDKEIEFIYSSDLKRAKQTGEIVSEGLGVDLSFHSELREGNMGIFEGEKKTIVKSDLFWDIKSLNKENFYDYSYPNGETRRELQERLVHFVHSEIIPSGYENVCLSIHGGALRFLLLGLSSNTFFEIPIPNCVVYQATFNKKKWAIAGPL